MAQASKDRLPNPVPGDVVKALTELGISVTQVEGDEVYAYCPAHVRRLGKPDRTGKHWSVNSLTGIHYCFACHFSGPFWFIVKEVNGKFDDDEAVAWSKERESRDKTMRLLFGGQIVDPDLVPEVEVRESDLALYVYPPEDACEYRDLLPEAVDYYGILWDSENERWITPVREPYTDKLMGWQEKGHKDRFFRNYPKGMEKSTTLFGVNELSTDTAILVESPLDVARIFGVIGEEGMAVSSFGSKISIKQMELLSELGIRNLISAYDNDAAGDEGNQELLKYLPRQIRLKFWDYGVSKAKDPGDQTDEEIRRGYERAYGRMEWVPQWL